MSGLAQWFMLGPFFYQGRLVTSPRLYHYVPGTTQEKTAWSDRNQAITAPNPIVGDANGLVAGYFSGLYKIEVRTSDDAVILAQYDNVQIVDPVDSLEPVELRPEDYRGGPSSSGDNTDPILEAFSEFGAAGGVLRLAPGDYKFSGTLNRGDKRTIIQGAGIDVTFLTMTAQSSVLHGITGTGSLWLRDLTIRTQTPLSINHQMTAVRMDLDSTGITGGRYLHVEHVKVEGWNMGLYCDGGGDYGIELASYRHVIGKAGGPASDYVGGVLHMNRIQNGHIWQADVDQNHVGDHAIYCFGARALVIEQAKVKNATRTEAQALKVVGDGVTSTGAFNQWSVRDVDMENCVHGALFTTFGTETLRQILVDGLRAKDMSGSVNIPGGIVTVSLTGSARIDSIVLRALFGENLGEQGVHFTGSASSRIEQILIDGVKAKNWSVNSSGTYTLLGTSCNAAIIGRLHACNIEADGNSNGRTIWNVNSFGGYGGEDIEQFSYDNLREKNTTTPAQIPTINQADATPTLRFGRTYLMTNGSAQNITAFDDIIPGEEYVFLVGDGNTTLVDGASLLVGASANWNPQGTDVWRGVAVSSTVMREAGRSDNS